MILFPSILVRTIFLFSTCVASSGCISSSLAVSLRVNGFLNIYGTGASFSWTDSCSAALFCVRSGIQRQVSQTVDANRDSGSLIVRKTDSVSRGSDLSRILILDQLSSVTVTIAGWTTGLHTSKRSVAMYVLISVRCRRSSQRPLTAGWSPLVSRTVFFWARRWDVAPVLTCSHLCDWFQLLK